VWRSPMGSPVAASGPRMREIGLDRTTIFATPRTCIRISCLSICCAYLANARKMFMA
jgi:hypothetical protein